MLHARMLGRGRGRGRGRAHITEEEIEMVRRHEEKEIERSNRYYQ